MWFCSECGKKNSGKFCTYCGTEYVEVDEEFLASVPLDTTLSSEEPDDIFVRSEEEDEVCCASALFRKRDAEEKEIPFVTEEPTILDVDDDPISAKVEESSETVEEEIAPVEPENKSWFVSAGAMEKIELPDIEEEVSVMERKAPPVSPYWGEKDGHRAESWKSPFLRESHLSAEENGSAEFLRKEKTLVNADDISSPEEATAENSGILGVFTHRFVPESEDEKVMRFGQRAIIAVGAVVGVICLAAIIMIGSLFINFGKDDDEIPSPTGIYYYVSGVEDTACLYADSSIISEVLAELENGDSVEFLEEVNGRFTFVYHEESDQYGYIRSSELVANLADVDYGNIENIYANEKSLGYWYVTNTQNGLNLWENPDGGGVVKAKLENGFKVSVLEKTNNSYWYVFDYNSAERGYVRTAYLTDDESKVVGIDKEPEDKTVIGDYFVTGVKNYLPIYSDTSTSSTVRGKLYNGDKVGLIEKTNSTFWYISANGVYGWVSASYLTATDPNPPEPEPTPPPDTSNDYKVYNTQEYLPVLKDPQVGGEELGRIYNGDTVTFIKEYDDKFWYVKVPSLGIEGYVAKEYLTK